MDETWEQRKARERELAAKKRGRVNNVMAEEQEDEIPDSGGGLGRGGGRGV